MVVAIPRCLAALLAGGVGLVAGSLAAFQGASPADVLARLKAAEAELRSGEVRYRVTTRTAIYDGAVDLAAADRALATASRPFGDTHAHLRFTRFAWRQESDFVPAAPTIPRQRTLLGGSDGVRRTVQWVGDRIDARVEPDGGSATLPSLESVLRGQVAFEVATVEWERAVFENGHLRLVGRKGRRRLELFLDPRIGYRPTRLLLISVDSEEEITAIQSLQIEYRSDGGTPYPARVRHLVVGRLGERTQATEHDLRVEEARLGVPVSEAELAIALPRGALVTDVRGEVTVLYNLAERELTLAEVRERAALKVAQRGREGLTPDGGAAIGQPAPAFELKDLDGRPVRLGDYRGRVVLLTWFASW